mgnify:CR=1 FL=1
MRIVLKILLIFIFPLNVIAREKGETEITTEDGIEVFQSEKYYLLKKNVIIDSDNFSLNAENVKINFDKSLYDIIQLNAVGDVKFNSQEFKMSGKGENLQFLVKLEEIKVEGLNSELFNEDVKMFSDGYIQINNLNGDFSLKGKNSKLINENIIIIAESIDGIFLIKDNQREISFLDVFDNNMSYVKNNNTEMYAKKINFNSDTSIIELIENVTIIREDEKISGDYGTLDTKNNSYKIKSNNDTKVKVVIKNNE